MKTRRLLAAFVLAAGFVVVGSSAIAFPHAAGALAQTDHGDTSEVTTAQESEVTPAEAEESGEHSGARDHAAEECIEILEKGGKADDCQEAPSLIMPAMNELVWGGLAFIIVFLLLAKLGYPALKKMMDDRTERIRESLDGAERSKNEAQGILDEYQRQLADARSEANRIIEEARQTADQLRRDLVTRAEQEAQELRQRTQEDIVAAQSRALADLQSQIRDLTIDLAEKIVQRQLDRDTNRALVDGFIAELERS